MPEDFTDAILYTQARIVTRAEGSPPLLGMARKRALDPSIFDEYPPYIWQSEISSDRLDAYYTVMDPETTLVNFAADAQAGVAVLVGHDSRLAPTGYSLTGEIERGSVTRVLSDAYALQDPATAPIVNKVRAGVIRDVSVGFSTRGAECLCSICGRDMWRDYRCWHIPGLRYKRTDNPEDAVTDAGGELATGRIVGARLSEYSLVYDGATPGAAILQAQRSAEAGRLTLDQARSIERQYHIHLPTKRITAGGFSMSKELETDRDTSKESAIDVRELQRLVEGSGAPKDSTIAQGVAWLAAEVGRLAPLAKDGETYRTDLIAAGVAEAVRAFGAEKGEAKRAQLERFDLDTIKDMTESWRELGDRALPGGRKSTDATPDDAPPAPRPVRVGGLSRA